MGYEQKTHLYETTKHSIGNNMVPRHRKFFLHQQYETTKQKAYISNASRNFCFLISKYTLVECLLSSTLVNPERYLSESSHFPASSMSSKYFMSKYIPLSRSSLWIKNWKEKDTNAKRLVIKSKTKTKNPEFW